VAATTNGPESDHAIVAAMFATFATSAIFHSETTCAPLHVPVWADVR
jgi:hypothetical protein